MQDLIKMINNFDVHYSMTNDHNRYMSQSRLEKEISASIESLSLNEKIELASKLEEHYLNYFGLNDLPQPTESKEKVQKKTSPVNRSLVFKNAWAYMTKGIYRTFSECLKASWKAYKTLQRLKSGIVSITYRKATGEIREAKGTLNNNLFTYSGKGARKESKADLLKYFDLEKSAWRAFRIERLISVA